MENMRIRVVALCMWCVFRARLTNRCEREFYNPRRLSYIKGCSEKGVLLPAPALEATLACCLLVEASCLLLWLGSSPSSIPPQQHGNSLAG